MALDCRPVEALPMLLRVRDGFEPLVRRSGVVVTMDSPEGSLWMQADPVRLQQCVINLVSNGIKYNHPGGSVHIAAHAEAEGVVIRIADTGRGMSPEQLAHLFERFNRLGVEGSVIEGSGIGLVITRELVRQMGGQIEVESAPERGTSFRLWLPSAKPPALGATGSPAAVAPDATLGNLPPGEELVEALYIEDNETNVALMQAMVARRPGVKLRIARSGQQAITSLKERGARLVLVDMNLGDCHGLDLIGRLRSEVGEPGRMHVAVSADASRENIEQALAAGFDRYITKPVRLGILLGLFDEFLQVSNEPEAH
jgi:CheY-like chemotaxis protein/anti-sigma regulatory factor (Ser/Thr protein kinase)